MWYLRKRKTAPCVIKMVGQLCTLSSIKSARNYGAAQLAIVPRPIACVTQGRETRGVLYCRDVKVLMASLPLSPLGRKHTVYLPKSVRIVRIIEVFFRNTTLADLCAHTGNGLSSQSPHALNACNNVPKN